MFDDVNVFSKLHWQSDWNGYEVGHPQYNVVGYYTYHDLNLYIDVETMNILEAWFYEEE